MATAANLPPCHVRSTLVSTTMSEEKLLLCSTPQSCKQLAPERIANQLKICSL
jgi:hypothetical protein